MAKTKLFTFYICPYGIPSGHVFKMVSLAITVTLACGSRRVRDKSITGIQFYQGRFTTAPRLVRICVASV